MDPNDFLGPTMRQAIEDAQAMLRTMNVEQIARAQETLRGFEDVNLAEVTRNTARLLDANPRTKEIAALADFHDLIRQGSLADWAAFAPAALERAKAAAELVDWPAVRAATSAESDLEPDVKPDAVMAFYALAICLGVSLAVYQVGEGQLAHGLEMLVALFIAVGQALERAEAKDG